MGSKKEGMGRIGWKMPNYLHIKFQAHGLLAFISLSIGSWIKNCDLTFVESLGFPPLAPMQLGFCRGWASQRKKLRNLLRPNFLQSPLSSFQRGTQAGKGELGGGVITSRNYIDSSSGKGCHGYFFWVPVRVVQELKWVLCQTSWFWIPAHTTQ